MKIAKVPYLQQVYVSDNGEVFRGDPMTDLRPARLRYPRGRAQLAVRDVHGQKRYPYVHRMMWEAFVGPIPDGMTIDHINRVKGDNSLSNLRLATTQQQARNSGPHRDNRSGVRGVVRKPSGRFGAHIRDGGRQRWLGMFEDQGSARAARVRAEQELFGEFASQ